MENYKLLINAGCFRCNLCGGRSFLSSTNYYNTGPISNHCRATYHF